jgi:hypothetical protein
MSTIKDEYIILTCWHSAPLKKIRTGILNRLDNAAKEGDLTADYSNYISPVLSNIANITYSLFIPADGSTEGWTTSNIMDDIREWLDREIVKHNAKNRGPGEITVIKVTVGDYEGIVTDYIRPGEHLTGVIDWREEGDT